VGARTQLRTWGERRRSPRSGWVQASPVRLQDGKPPQRVSVGGAWVVSNSVEYFDDQHMANGQPADPLEPAWARHEMGDVLGRSKRDVWPVTVDFNAQAMVQQGAEDDFNQPKLYAILGRDSAGKRDP
jgi:hypothetical protein